MPKSHNFCWFLAVATQRPQPEKLSDSFGQTLCKQSIYCKIGAALMINSLTHPCLVRANLPNSQFGVMQMPLNTPRQPCKISKCLATEIDSRLPRGNFDWQLPSPKLPTTRVIGWPSLRNLWSVRYALGAKYSCGSVRYLNRSAHRQHLNLQGIAEK